MCSYVTNEICLNHTCSCHGIFTGKHVWVFYISIKHSTWPLYKWTGTRIYFNIKIFTCFCNHPLRMTFEFSSLEAAGALMVRDLPLFLCWLPLVSGLCGGVRVGASIIEWPVTGWSNVVVLRLWLKIDKLIFL
jgi:hypothetical protein